MEQINTSLPDSLASSEVKIDYLKIKELICKQIMYVGQNQNMDRIWGHAKFQDLIEHIFYEKILKISRQCSKYEIQTAFEDWAKIARGLNAQKKKSYLKTAIINAWRDLQKSVAHRNEENTAHLVSEKPLNKKEHAVDTLQASNALASSERPELHRDKDTFEFESEHKFAACKLFFELTWEERSLLSLTYNDDLGLVEIGKRTGISKSSVKRKRDALYQRLKTFMLKEATLNLGAADLYEVIGCMLELFEKERNLDLESFKQYTVKFMQTRQRGTIHEPKT